MANQDVLIITGGSRGIGAAIARKAAAKGYAVCIAYVRDEAAASGVVADLRASGARAAAFQGDVADEGFAAKVFDFAEQELGPVTALVNNVGVTGRIGKFLDADVKTMRTVLDTNVLGTMMMAQEALRRWQAAEIPGRMVNISSVAATLGAPNEYVHYAASKAAVETFTLGLAKEVAASGIRVNAVSPGTTYTDIHATMGEPNRPQRVVARVPMARIGEPAEIADGVLWLLSAEASFTTGTVLRISGGV